jgi:hypothetical protein
LWALFFGLIFLVGLTQLFLWRFEAGNVYPVYSSLRSDPLGTRALFEGYDRLASTAAERNFRPWPRFNFDAKTTLMIIGIAGNDLGRDGARFDELLDELARKGGRLVLTMAGSGKTYDPGDRRRSNTGDVNKKGKSDGAAPSDVIVDPQGSDDHGSCKSQKAYEGGFESLGLTIRSISGEPSDDVAVLLAGRPDILPLNIPWRSHLYFECQDSRWEMLYAWQASPVMVQRSWGNGTVVAAADTYFLSNEAMRNDRRSELLAWLALPGNKITVDEYHKGIVQQPGVAGLARQYRLHGLFGALLVVAVLFIWRQSAIFVPTVQSEQHTQYDSPTVGRDTGQAMVHLAGRHIRAQEVLSVCFDTWKRQAARRVAPSRLSEVRAMVQAAAGDSRKTVQVHTYNQICQLLKRGKGL